MEIPLHRLQAVDLAEAYRRRSLSPIEVTKSVIDQIGRIDPVVHAFVSTTPETGA